MNTQIVSIIIAFIAGVLSWQAQPITNRGNADSISSRQSITPYAVEQISIKNNIKINGTDNLVTVENMNSTVTNSISVSRININGIHNAERIKQGTNGQVLIWQNGNGNQVSVIKKINRYQKTNNN